VKLLTTLCSLLATLPALAAGPNDLPDLGSAADAAISLDDEFRLGQMMMRSLRDADQIIGDPEVSQYIDAVGHRLSSVAQDGNRKFTFFVVKDPTINAFALPGGFVGVNSGLLLETHNESELAGVLAHEISHVTQRHIARSLVEDRHNSVLSIAAMLAAILVGATSGHPDAAMAGVAATQTLALEQQMTFSRASEIEADRVGMTVLEAAGFDPNGMPDFFGTLARYAGPDESQMPAIMRSHPITTERIAESKNRAVQYLEENGAIPHKNSIGYELIRERLRVLGTPPGENPEDYYKEARHDSNRSAASKYGEAIALIANDKPQQAIPILQALRRNDESVAQYHTALALAQAAANETTAALETFEQARRLFPRNVPVTVRYADTLMHANQPKKAHEILLDLFNMIAPTPQQARQIALAANAAGDTADAYSYMAEYHLMNGDLPTAMNQLQLALAVPNTSSLQRARYRARLEEIRAALPRRLPRNLESDERH
jgi:beta-barrel assembly-enhancing protease